MYKLVDKYKGSIETWIQGLTAPTVTMSPWIQLIHNLIVREGSRPVHVDGKMHLKG